jgi:RNA polymerase sigma-70 factor, ECF subfamily
MFEHDHRPDFMPSGLWPRARAPRLAKETLVHADALYNLARYLTRDSRDAEDLVQETYERALQAWDQREPVTNVKAWLFQILRNGFISRHRQGLRRPALESYDNTEETLGRTLDEGSGSAAGAVPDQIRRMVSRDIEAALRTLSEDARIVILLDLDGSTDSEVALVIGCAVGTVKSRLNRARAALRLRLADYGSTGGPARAGATR